MDDLKLVILWQDKLPSIIQPAAPSALAGFFIAFLKSDGNVGCMSEPLIKNSQDGLTLLDDVLSKILKDSKYSIWPKELKIIRRFKTGQATLNELSHAIANMGAQLT